VIVLPDRLIDDEHKLAKRLESCRITEVDLELRIERFLIAVLPWASRCRTRDHHANSLQSLNMHISIVFAAVVAVEDSRSRIVVQGVHECREHELYRVVGVYREADDLSGIEVDDGGDIHESPLVWDIREVCRPDVILVHWLCGHQEIWINHLDIRCSVPFLASSAVCLDAEDVHHSLHLLAVHLEMDGEAT